MFERDTPINVLTKHCKGCVYFSDSTKTCDYLIMTEQRRPCPPGIRCTVKKPYGNPKAGVGKLDRNDMLRALYKAGKNDREISEATGFSLSAIFKWRERHHYTPNYNGGRPKQDRKEV